MMNNVDDTEGPNYREKLDISQVFLRQRDRTNFAASIGGDHYASYVRQTMRMLPVKWQRWVMDQADRYEKNEMVLVFRKFCRVRMGKQKDPLVRNDMGDWGLSSEKGFDVDLLEDGSVDWSDSRIVSPTLTEKSSIDYEEWDKVISEASELAGISWQEEKVGVDGGDADWVDREKRPYIPQEDL